MNHSTKRNKINEVDSPTVVKGILIVNKKHPLPKNYALGENPNALLCFKALLMEAQKEGLNIGNHYSGYRSYAYQEKLYNRYCKEDGQEKADTYSARPGYSEHQTGLAFDVCNKQNELVTSEKEVNWIARNASRFGFIVRYPSGKESITGYDGEPWHLRYIGDLAIKIEQSGLTLEEFLEVEGGTSYK